MNPSKFGDQYPNLNILRLFLAVFVTLSHSFPLTGTSDPMPRYLGQIDGGRVGVWGFFFISGFLVTRSYVLKPHALSFILSRALRIWPGLLLALCFAVCVAACASSASGEVFWPAARQYFSHNGKLLEGVMYQLPGAFSGIPNSSVNGSLWTLPWELRMYAFVLVLGVCGILARRDSANLALLLAGLFLFALPKLDYFRPYVSNVTTPWVLAAFLLGMWFYLNISKEQQVRTLVGGVVIGLFFLLATNLENAGWLFLLCSTIGLLGFTDLVKLPDVQNDFSYGVYIYSFPVQQFLIWKFDLRNPWLVSVYSLLCVFVLAAISWFAVERPAIRLRKNVTDFLKKRGPA